MSDKVFRNLFHKDVSSYTKQVKAGNRSLSYLSWSHAWAELKKDYPDATYKIKKFGEAQLPYVYDENTGYMVFTEVTIAEQTHEMWLPVMDGANKAMKSEPYTYQVINWVNGKRDGFKDKSVEQASMFDINTAIMRCLTKNLAMFGLGLYIYSGEDLPEAPLVEIEYLSENDITIIEQRIKLLAEVTEGDLDKNIEKLTNHIIGKASVDSLEQIQKDHLNSLLQMLDGLITKQKEKNKPKEEPVDKPVETVDKKEPEATEEVEPEQEALFNSMPGSEG